MGKKRFRKDAEMNTLSRHIRQTQHGSVWVKDGVQARFDGPAIVRGFVNSNNVAINGWKFFMVARSGVRAEACGHFVGKDKYIAKKGESYCMKCYREMNGIEESETSRPSLFDDYEESPRR